MFLESEIDLTKNNGSIEVICGSMFSGKTEELLRRLKRARFAKLEIIVFKPRIDTRYDRESIVSHNANNISSKVVESTSEILESVNEENVVAIDEAQFFTENLVEVCNALANQGKRVIVAGLDMDFLGKPFGVMPKILAIAENITKLHAICVDCGSIANYSFRLTKNQQLIELGQKNEYKPLCRNCFMKNVS